MLKRIDFKSIVVSDQTQKTQIAYSDRKKGLEAFPLTVLIDQFGLVRWIGDPKNFSETVMNEFLGITIPKKEATAESVNKAALSEPKAENSQNRVLGLLKDKGLVYFFEFRKANKAASASARVGNSLLFYSHISIKDLYANLSNVDQKLELVYKNQKDRKEDIIKLETDMLSILNLQKNNPRNYFNV